MQQQPVVEATSRHVSLQLTSPPVKDNGASQASHKIISKSSKCVKGLLFRNQPQTNSSFVLNHTYERSVRTRPRGAGGKKHTTDKVWTSLWAKSLTSGHLCCVFPKSSAQRQNFVQRREIISRKPLQVGKHRTKRNIVNTESTYQIFNKPPLTPQLQYPWNYKEIHKKKCTEWKGFH